MTTRSKAWAFSSSSSCKFLRAGIELLLDRLERRDVDGRGDHVVGRLAHVDRVVGVDRDLAAADAVVELLVGDARDHLVGVHVGRGAAAGLEDVEDELVVVLALGDRLRGLDDRRAELGRKQASPC